MICIQQDGLILDSVYKGIFANANVFNWYCFHYN